MNTTYTIDMAYIGQLMQHMVRGAIKMIRTHAHNPIPKWKLGYGQSVGDVPNDFATQGDTDAQEYYRQTIVSDDHCAGFGIIAEEGLAIPCTHPVYDVYFTIDPLDGTKAYERRQSHEVGTMVALVVDGNIMAVYIGDINTEEIYGYTKDLGREVFIHPPTRYRFGEQEFFSLKAEKPLITQYLHLRDAPHKLEPVVSTMFVGEEGLAPLFKDITVDGGSIGICVGRAWKHVVGAVAMITSAHETPWDRTPIIGMNQVLGFVTLRLNKDGVFEELSATPSKVMVTCDHLTVDLVIHRDRLGELDTWLSQYEAKRRA